METRLINPLYKYIGLRVRELRELHGLRQSDVADAMGITRTSVTNLESGIQKMPLHHLYTITELLDVDLSDILPNKVSDDLIRVIEQIEHDSIQREIAAHEQAIQELKTALTTEQTE